MSIDFRERTQIVFGYVDCVDEAVELASTHSEICAKEPNLKSSVEASRSRHTIFESRKRTQFRQLGSPASAQMWHFKTIEPLRRFTESG